MKKVFSFLLIASAAFCADTIPPRNPPKVYAPTKFDTYSSYCGLWRTDATFESTIRLSNQLVTSTMDATVTLFMADGTPYVLPIVHLEKAGVTTVNVNAALANAPAKVLPHLSSFGRASVSYRYDWQGVVYAAMSILDIPRSLQYTYAFMFPMHTMAMEDKPASTTMEGMAWSYTRSSVSFLSFSNSSNRDIDVEVTADGGRVERFMVAGQSTVLRTLRISEPDDAGHRLGGMRITFNADPDSMNVVGGIEDDEHGYSANIPLAVTIPSSGATLNSSMASPGIMVGKQDPMMGFPADLRFQPYAYFRNVSDSPIHLSSTLNYGKAQSIALPELRIPPHQSRELTIPQWVQNLDGAVTLAFSYTGDAGTLLVATGSVDQSGNYVFAVEPRGAAQTASQSAIYWQMANGFDTMWTLWNSSNNAQDVLLTFRYGANQTYEYPVHIDPNGAAMVDIKMIAEMGMPDKHGHMLPLTASEGSLVVSADSGNDFDPIHIVLAGGIYNPKTATCGAVCCTCNGCSQIPSTLNPGSLSIPVSNSGWFYAQCPWYNGTIYDYSTSSSWSSNNTGVATVQTGSNGGLTYGSGGGSTTISSFGPQVPPNAGQVCTGGSPPPSCPYGTPVQTGQPKVQVPTSLSVVSATVAANGCGGSQNYGIKADIKYQVLDQSGLAIQVSGMTPYEQGKYYDGTNLPHGQLGAATDSQGTFHDVPQGLCSNLPINTTYTATQTISVVMNNVEYTVRSSQHLTISDTHGGAGFGHGTLVNDFPNTTKPDINVSR